VGDEPASRHTVESVGRGGAAHARRLEQRLRRRRRRAPGALGTWHRYRMFGPPAPCMVRRYRIEGLCRNKALS
jgi:hypothetical protein